MKRSRLACGRKLLVTAMCCALYGHDALAQAESESELGAGVLIEEVVIWGLRASQARAVDLKRTSANVVDAIVAEDIGRMPDTTITDSLQRIPGVQINREANEGTSLNVRGMPQVLTTLNGEQFLSPWSITGVGANYSDIPAGMIGGADVYKSMSSHHIAGGISGLINLKTIDPTELESGWTGKFKLEGSQGSLQSDQAPHDGLDHDLSFYVGHKGDRFSVIGGAFHSSTNAANYQIVQEQRLGFLDTKGGIPGDPLDLDGDGDLVNDWYLVPADYEAGANFMERERLGASLGMNFEINPSLNVRADIFYTSMDQKDRGINAFFDGENNVNSYSVNNEAPEGEQSLYNVLQADSRVGFGSTIRYTDANGQQQTRDIHTLRVAEIQSTEFQTASTSDSDATGALNTNLQFDYQGDKLFASVRFVHADARKESRVGTFIQGTPAFLWIDVDGIQGKDPLDTYDVTVDYTGNIPSYDFERDVSDAGLLRKYQGFANGEDTDASLNVARFDFKYDLDFGIIESVEGGLRYGVRDAENNYFYYVTPTSRYSEWADPRVPNSKHFLLREGNEVWQKFPNWRDFDYEYGEDPRLKDPNIGNLQDNGFDRSDTIVFSDFGPISGFEGGVSALDPTAWDEPLSFMNQLYPGTKTISDPGASYKVEEASTSLYAQMNFDFELSIPISGNFGLRYVDTLRTVDQADVPLVLDKYNSIGYSADNKVVFVADVNQTEHSFTDVLPSLNLNLYPTDEWVVRLAASRTMARNDLANVGAGLILQYQSCIKTDENGDPVNVIDENGNPVPENVTCVARGEQTGKPDIKPWRATVLNATGEWYFAENALLSASLFYIGVDESVEVFEVQRSFVDGDGINRGHTANVLTTANATGDSDLTGLELGYRQPFTFFKNPILNSTGIEFNYTFSNSESADIDISGDSLPLESNSAHQTNLILWYEKDAFSVRLAYNWRSEEYKERLPVTSSETPFSLGNWQEPTGYLDLSVGYWLNDYVSFFFNGTNLTEENQYTYAQYSDQFHSLRVQERRLALGLTISI